MFMLVLSVDGRPAYQIHAARMQWRREEMKISFVRVAGVETQKVMDTCT